MFFLFVCFDPNHLIWECKAWKQKNAASKSKSIAFMQSIPNFNDVSPITYKLFIFTGAVSISSESEERQIRIHRDTGASRSFILRDIFPFSAESYKDTDVFTVLA